MVNFYVSLRGLFKLFFTLWDGLLENYVVHMYIMGYIV